MTDSVKKHQPSEEHKAAMGRGRRASSVVGSYLEALELNKPKRGRRVSPEELEARIEKARETISSDASALQRLNATQEVMDLERRLNEARAPKIDLSELEKGFIEYGAAYSESKGISYEAFRSFGVPSSVLKAAGIHR